MAPPFKEGSFTNDHLLQCCLGVGESQGIMQSLGLVIVVLLPPPGLDKQGEETVNKTCRERVL